MTYNCEIKQDGDWYSVEFPDMPNILTCGQTKEEALKMAEDALNGVLSSHLDNNYPISKPQFTGGFPITVAPRVAFAIELRKARGNRTQKEIANLAGMTYQQYQRLENPRKTNPTLEVLFKLQKAVGINFLTL